MLVTGKPHHSESNGGIERRNRTVEEKISKWMHENQSKHWAQSLPFIQWRCNTQIHQGIGNRTPYHLMFGQHPQVGISNLPIAPHMLANLATEMDVNRCLGLEPDVPLEHATLPMSAKILVRTTGSQGSSQLSRPGFTSLGFTSDRTEELVAKFIRKVTVNSPNGSYFGWKGLGFQCGALFLSLPSHVNLNMESYLMMTGGFSTNKQHTTNASFGNLKSPPEELDATTPLKAPSTVRLLPDGCLFS